MQIYIRLSVLLYCLWLDNNNSNTGSYDYIYDPDIMAQPLQEFTQFIW